MTKVLLVAPRQELVLHNIPIYDNTDVKKVQAFITDKTKDYGEIRMVLFSLGDIRIMTDQEEIPVPLQPAPGGKGR
jgi:hypothetical protein